MKNTDRAKILSTVSKLLAKAAGTTNEHEAAVFSAKARQLMETHEIVPGDLVASGDLVERREVYPDRSRAPEWLVDLWCTVSKRMGCTCLYVSRYQTLGGLAFYVYGRAEDAERAAYISRHLAREIDRAAVENARGKGKAFARSYRLGIIHGIRRRLDALVHDVAPDKTPSPFAVVLADAAAKAEEAKRYAVEVNDGIGTAASRRNDMHRGALVAGVRDADSISISKAVSAASEDSGRLLV